MNNLSRYRIAILIVVATFAMSAVLYPRLPEVIPTQWSAAGVVDGWMPKLRGAFFAPILSLVIVAGLIVFEPIKLQEDAGGLDPRYYPVIVAGVAGLIFFCNLWVLMAGLGWHLALP